MCPYKSGLTKYGVGHYEKPTKPAKMPSVRPELSSADLSQHHLLLCDQAGEAEELLLLQ